MRSRAPLALMEQLVMVLVFALAAALCLRAFALADTLSRQQETRDRALLACQQAAEELKANRGLDLTGQTLYFDENWLALPSPEGAAYVLTAARQRAPVPGLGRAEVSVCPAEGGEVLAALPVAWQEVAHG